MYPVVLDNSTKFVLMFKACATLMRKKSYGQKDRHKDKDRNVRTLPLETHFFLLNKYKSCLFFLQRTYSNHPHFLINKNTHYNISDLCFYFNSVIFFNYLTWNNNVSLLFKFSWTRKTSYLWIHFSVVLSYGSSVLGIGAPSSW